MPHEPYAQALLGYNDRVLPQPKARPEKERAVNSGAAVYPFHGQLNKSKQKPASNNAGSFYDYTALLPLPSPVWGETRWGGLIFYTARFQSTLPRGERRFNIGNGGSSGKISIHAPVRGATIIAPFAPKWNPQISIHAPWRYEPRAAFFGFPHQYKSAILKTPRRRPPR